MTELSSRAREVLETARAHTALPLERRAAMKVSLAKSLSSASVVTTATSSALALKVVVVTVLTAAIFVGVQSSRRSLAVSRPLEQPGMPLVPRGEVVTPVASPPPFEPSSPVVTAPKLVKQPVRAARPMTSVAPPAAAPSPLRNDVSTEVVALERAVQALAAGLPGEALETAQTTLGANPKVALRPEFVVIEVEALCDLNRIDEAQAVEHEMTAEERSPLVLERLRRSCVGVAR